MYFFTAREQRYFPLNSQKLLLSVQTGLPLIIPITHQRIQKLLTNPVVPLAAR